MMKSLLIVAITVFKGCLSKGGPRNIILLVGDDIGWNEVSWNNPSFLTPNMERLQKEGVLLTNSYATPKCSPSRAALMTGYYPWRIGMQRGAIERFQPDGLNTSLKILPEYLKEAGYKTHLVGKWHLGYCHPNYLPNNRGFDTHFGQWNHVTDYYTRLTEFPDHPNLPKEMVGYDWHENGEISHEGENEYSPDLLSRKAVELIDNHNKSSPMFLYVAFQAAHGPITEPPKKYLDLYLDARVSRSHLNRAATVSAMDAAIGNIVNSLKQNGMYDNSVIVFTSDNGGSVLGFSNLPLRGDKEYLYEGGVKTVGFLTGGAIRKPGRVEKGLIYITDWFATFLHAAGLKHKIPDDVDSFNVWRAVSRGRKSQRKSIIFNIDRDTEHGLWSAAVRYKNYKLILGQSVLLKQRKPTEQTNKQLFNLEQDPYERMNLVTKEPWTLSKLEKIISESETKMAPARYTLHYKKWKNAWPGNQSGKNKGYYTTGWCEPVT